MGSQNLEVPPRAKPLRTSPLVQPHPQQAEQSGYEEEHARWLGCCLDDRTHCVHPDVGAGGAAVGVMQEGRIVCVEVREGRYVGVSLPCEIWAIGIRRTKVRGA